MDVLRDGSPMVTQDVVNRRVVRLLGAEMSHSLTSELIDQISMIVIGHIVVVDEFADDVVFKAGLFDHGGLAVGQLTA